MIVPYSGTEGSVCDVAQNVGAAGVVYDWCGVCWADAGCGVCGDGGGGAAEVGAGAGVFCAGVRDDVLGDGAAGVVGGVPQAGAARGWFWVDERLR